MNNRVAITAYEVAAFTNHLNGGSPTGVVLDAQCLNDAQMQAVARALGHSHTAFVIETCQADYDVAVRFFTPAQEIRNCGHGTIAAHILRAMQRDYTGTGRVKQRVLSGIQEVDVWRRDGSLTVSLRQDPIRFEDVPAQVVSRLLTALKITEDDLDARYPIISASPGSDRFLLPLKSASVLQALAPDFPELQRLCDDVGSIGCFAFALDEETTAPQASARMFAPGIGVDEDNINGNSSGCLGAYLLRLDTDGRWGSELTLHVHQGYVLKRPGTVLITARWVGDQIETTMGGSAVLVGRTQMTV